MESETFKAKGSVLKISKFTIDTCYGNIIEKGAYGIVYKTADADNKAMHFGCFWNIAAMVT